MFEGVKMYTKIHLAFCCLYLWEQLFACVYFFHNISSFVPGDDWYVCYSSSFGQVFQNQKFNQSQLPLSGRYYLKNCAFFEMCKILLFLKNMLLWVPQLSLNEYILVGLQQSLRFYRMKSKHHKVSLLLTTYNISVFNTDKRKACSVYLKVNVLQFYWVHDEE